MELKGQPARSAGLVCPDCGYDDEEAGRLLADDELLCPLCWDDYLRAVRVIRWLPGEPRPHELETRRSLA